MKIERYVEREKYRGRVVRKKDKNRGEKAREYIRCQVFRIFADFSEFREIFERIKTSDVRIQTNFFPNKISWMHFCDPGNKSATFQS